MKKNMLAVLILVLCIVNITLSGYIVFSVVPNAQRTDELITKIMQIIDLELESPVAKDVVSNYNIKDVEKFEIEDLTTNIATGADGKAHFAKVSVSLTINKAHEDYEQLGPLVGTFKPDIAGIVKRNVSMYTYEQQADLTVKRQIKEDVLADIQQLFDSKFIVDCTVDILIQ